MNVVYKISKLLWGVAIVFSVLVISSCKKFVEIPAPKNLIADENVFTSDATAIAVLTGIYTNMSKSAGTGSGGFTGVGSISLFTGLSADEFDLYNSVNLANYNSYYQNALTVNGIAAGGFEHWAPLYNYIYKSNAAIEGLAATAANALTPAVRQQLLGEAKFMRAFFYCYLVNLYGDVPLALTTDYKINAALPRTNADLVYQQVITDLKDAQTLLADGYLDASLLKGTSERVRPTKWAATALLARVYLYKGEYALAEAQATEVINAPLFSLAALNDVFKKNSNEAIWQLQPVTTGHNTEDGWTFVLPATGPSGVSGVSFRPAYLSNQLLTGFEADDQRAVTGNWINNVTVEGITYYYPYKYKSATLNAPVTEYLMVLRLGEQYLIRAEARAQQNKTGEAQADLNVIRTRAGLPNTTAADKNALLTTILHERQVELFTEWGHRWFDLKRTGNVDAVMTAVTPLKANGAAWKSYQQLYPLPLTDLQRNTKLVQNPGYN